MDLDEPLNMESNSFQSVLCIHSLYLLKKPQHLLHEFCRILKVGGYLIICNPCRSLSGKEIYDAGKQIFSEGRKNRGFWETQKLSYSLLAAGAINFLIQLRKDDNIFHCWTSSEIELILKETGFKIEKIEESCIKKSHLMVIARKLP